MILIITIITITCILALWASDKKTDKDCAEARYNAFSKKYGAYRAKCDKVDPYERRFGRYCDLNEEDYSNF